MSPRRRPVIWIRFWAWGIWRGTRVSPPRPSGLHWASRSLRWRCQSVAWWWRSLWAPAPRRRRTNCHHAGCTSTRLRCQCPWAGHELDASAAYQTETTGLHSKSRRCVSRTSGFSQWSGKRFHQDCEPWTTKPSCRSIHVSKSSWADVV